VSCWHECEGLFWLWRGSASADADVTTSGRDRLAPHPAPMAWWHPGRDGHNGGTSEPAVHYVSAAAGAPSHHQVTLSWEGGVAGEGSGSEEALDKDWRRDGEGKVGGVRRACESWKLRVGDGSTQVAVSTSLEVGGRLPAGRSCWRIAAAAGAGAGAGGPSSPGSPNRAELELELHIRPVQTVATEAVAKEWQRVWQQRLSSAEGGVLSGVVGADAMQGLPSQAAIADYLAHLDLARGSTAATAAAAAATAGPPVAAEPAPMAAVMGGLRRWLALECLCSPLPCGWDEWVEPQSGATVYGRVAAAAAAAG
jgi:hypothetical protein